MNLGVLLSPGEIALMRDRFDSLVATEREASGHEVSQSVGIARLSATVLKDVSPTQKSVVACDVWVHLISDRLLVL